VEFAVRLHTTKDQQAVLRLLLTITAEVQVALARVLHRLLLQLLLRITPVTDQAVQAHQSAELANPRAKNAADAKLDLQVNSIMYIFVTLNCLGPAGEPGKFVGIYLLLDVNFANLIAFRC
jgi:hypothetical protein